MAVSKTVPPSDSGVKNIWILPVLLLCSAYALLGLTFTEKISHTEIMQRCVLVNPNLSRIWSVAHIEIGAAYLGVFIGMAFYIIRASRYNRTHLTDLSLALLYVLCSFILDFACVQLFYPFVALLIGDAIVMTFTLIVSKQLWFQRLLGVFVPMVFLTCAFGHFMEGLSYWHLTYPVNVPWTMVTADVGFAIVVNAVQFPAFIHGQDIINELENIKAEAKAKRKFFHDVLQSVTDGRLNLCASADELPVPLSSFDGKFMLTKESMSAVRHEVVAAARALQFEREQIDCLQTATGEALMNAVVHGGGGDLSIYSNDDSLQIWVTDHGTGIQMSQLPRAALERGFSTKGTLGQGFWLMLQTADNLDLLTNENGTTIVITVYREFATYPATHHIDNATLRA